MQRGLAEPDLYGDLVNKLRKMLVGLIFLISSEKDIMRYKHNGNEINVMRQSACLVINPVTVDSVASLFNCTPVGRASDQHKAG